MAQSVSKEVLKHLTSQLQHCGLQPGQHRIAVAVSGGSDSLALALLTSWWGRQPDAATVKQQQFSHQVTERLIHDGNRAASGMYAVIVDHGLRGESADEARLTQTLVSSWGLQPLVLKAEWPLGRPSRGKLMNAARLERQRLFTSACRQHGITHLLVAHQADDQAETFLLRLSRGSGLGGLAGMTAASMLLPGHSAVGGRASWSRREIGSGGMNNSGDSTPTTTTATTTSASTISIGASCRQDRDHRDDVQVFRPSAQHVAADADPSDGALPGSGDPLLATRIMLLRPLLDVSRQTLRQVLTEAGVQWVEDPTNRDRTYSRNALRYMIAGASESHIPSPMAADLLRLQRRCTAAEQMARAQAAHLLTACTSSPDHVPAGQRVSPGQPERSFRQSRATAGESTAQTLTGKAEMPHKQLIHVAPLAAASLPILSRVVASLLQAVSGTTVQPSLRSVHKLAHLLQRGRLRRVFAGGGCRVAPVTGSRGLQAVISPA
mmetsp:Transcript_16951/g.50613  ORF Transcript_16951/g.50613 Transcript_16951/m.50613 type:complete len:493 (-) Transcript_16951:513-1991(-)